MLDNEEVNSIHGQAGHGVLQLLGCATVTGEAAQLKDNHHLVAETFEPLLKAKLLFSVRLCFKYCCTACRHSGLDTNEGF